MNTLQLFIMYVYILYILIVDIFYRVFTDINIQWNPDSLMYKDAMQFQSLI